MFSWTDEKLTWNTSQYADIVSMVFSIEDIWHPKLDLSNSFNNNYFHSNTDVVRVYSNGLTFYTKRIVLEAACGINVEFYPFDTQVSLIPPNSANQPRILKLSVVLVMVMDKNMFNNKQNAFSGNTHQLVFGILFTCTKYNFKLEMRFVQEFVQ